ncbi:MAG: type II toxin-antitoxin system Phd/YefM family antitoxin [Verrucomicrobiota bacterium]
MKATATTIPLKQAQANLPKLCKSQQGYLITDRDKATAVLLPIGDYEALIETMDLLSDPKAMKTLRAAKARGLTYKELDLEDENFGL